MTIFLQYILPSIIGASAAILAGIINYFQFRGKIKKEFEKLEKEHELLNRDYIKKVHYEEMFKIYKDMSQKLFDMAVDCLSLFPPGLDYLPENDTEEKQRIFIKRYNKACDTFNSFTKSLYANAPFFDEKVFDLLYKFREDCNLQIVWYPDLVLQSSKSIAKENLKQKEECYKRSAEIHKELEDCIKFIRLKLQEDESR